MRERIIDILGIVCNDSELIKSQPDIDLIESGLLDSLTFINLLIAIENEFGIEIQPTQVPQDTWRSVNSIVSLIDSLNLSPIN